MARMRGRLPKTQQGSLPIGQTPRSPDLRVLPGRGAPGMAIPSQKPHHSRPCRYRSGRGGARA